MSQITPHESEDIFISSVSFLFTQLQYYWVFGGMLTVTLGYSHNLSNNKLNTKLIVQLPVL